MVPASRAPPSWPGLGMAARHRLVDRRQRARSGARLSGGHYGRDDADVERRRRLHRGLHRYLATLSPLGFPQGRRARPGTGLADLLRRPRALLRHGGRSLWHLRLGRRSRYAAARPLPDVPWTAWRHGRGRRARFRCARLALVAHAMRHPGGGLRRPPRLQQLRRLPERLPARLAQRHGRDPLAEGPCRRRRAQDRQSRRAHRNRCLGARHRGRLRRAQHRRSPHPNGGHRNPRREWRRHAASAAAVGKCGPPAGARQPLRSGRPQSDTPHAWHGGVLGRRGPPNRTRV